MPIRAVLLVGVLWPLYACSTGAQLSARPSPEGAPPRVPLADFSAGRSVDISEVTVQAIQAAYAAREYSAVDLTRAFLSRIGQYESHYNALISMNPAALATAGMLDALTGTLEGGAPLIAEQIGCWTAESEVAELLRETEKTHEDCQIGSYPFFREGRTGANFVVRSTEQASLDACMEALKAGLRELGFDPVDGGI